MNGSPSLWRPQRPADRDKLLRKQLEVGPLTARPVPIPALFMPAVPTPAVASVAC